ncbi:uncharacterized protein LOC127841514 isoform X2 [Dreissena polymorpha]|uniref:uncharacterized protein LOC127841514 isoform X2 n=1 Tax=Dreissena polymorpha TaxID=45954 RepID=UPI0022656991|nr:uncharacterized protein LOC127841514 isoform X2 [Dreissena polymorpha]
MAEGYNLAYNNSIYEDLDNDGKAVIVGVDGRRASDACTFTLTDVQIGIPWSVLCNFDIEKHLKSNNIHVVKINESNSDGMFQCTSKSLPEVTNIFQRIVSKSFCSAPVRFKCYSALSLLKKNNKLNENAFLHLEKLCRQHKTHVYQCMISREFFVCGKTKTCVDQVQPVIERSIVEITLEKAEIKKIQAEIKQWISKGKLLKISEKENAVVFVATKDVQEDLNETVIDDHFFKLPSLESETLSKNEQSYTRLMELSKFFNVTVVHHDKHTELLHLKGTKHCVKKFLTEVLSMFYVKKEKIIIPSLKMYDVEQSLMKIADESNVCVELILPSQNEIGGSLIATWFNSDGRQLHLVQGNLFALKVDTILILCTDTCFPLVDMPVQPKEYRNPLIDKWTLGEAFISENTPPRCLVPVYDNKKCDENILKAGYQNAFSKMCGKRFKTIAFHATVINTVEPFIPHFLSEFIFASMKYPVETFICCSLDEDVSGVVKTINDCCLCAQEDRFKMTINTYLEGFQQIDVVVEAGALAFAKADVLVNTTDAHLTLSSGTISKQILKHAGTGILDECKRNYPSKMKEGSFAVTSSGNLEKISKAHNILHCVLPLFEKDKFDQVIQNMVKQVLVEADRMKCASIAIPLIGTGKLEYPVRGTLYSMLEAVYDYTASAICSSLKRIVLILHEDVDKNIQQFNEIRSDIEQERHGRFWPNLSQSHFPGVYKEIHSSMFAKLSTKVVLMVTSTAVMKHLPLSTVVFHVSSGIGKEVCLDRGSGLNFTSKYSKTEDAIDECVKATVTDVAFMFANGKQTSGILKQECLAVADHVSRVIGKAEYLRRVTILVPDVLFIETCKQLLATNSYFPGMARWTQTESNNVDVAYRVCAMEKVHTDTVQHYASLVNPDLGIGPDCSLDDYDVVNHDETCEYHHEEVTAVINEAIIKYLKDHGDLEKWILAVQKTYKLHVSSDKTIFIVGGGLQDMESFETYLMSDFPNFPQDALPKMKYDNPYQKENKAAVDKNNKDNLKESVEFCFGDISVSVCQGDITDSTNDCIISPTHRYILKTFGVAYSLLEKGGVLYEDSCREMDKQGKIDVTQCRVTASGNLKCKNVIHVGIPNFDQVCVKRLNQLEEAVFNCLVTAESHGLNSVAIPAIGTGVGNLTAEHCAQEIFRAVNRFGKNNRLINYISIVLLHENMVQPFLKVFKGEKSVPMIF